MEYLGGLCQGLRSTLWQVLNQQWRRPAPAALGWLWLPDPSPSKLHSLQSPDPSWAKEGWAGLGVKAGDGATG